MTTYNTLIKKLNPGTNKWDSLLPITTADNVLVDSEGNTVASHLADEANPHNTNKSDVGLSNVDNLSAASIRSGTTKANVGLGNVDNIKQMPISGGILENYTEKLTTLTGTSTAINLSLGNVFTHTLTGNTTYSIPNAVNSQSHSFTLIINMGAVKALTFPTSVKWQGGEVPDMTEASKTYVLTFMTTDGGVVWLGMFGGDF